MIRPFCGVCVALLGAADLSAHGGRYRGPGALALPLAEARLAAPRPARPAFTGLGADLSMWSFWWEIHQQSLTSLPRRGRRAARIPAQQVLGKILPVVRRALAQADAESQAAAAIALGKIARVGASADIRKLLMKALPSANQMVQESAALALGLTGSPDAIPGLAALATDSARGRQLVKKAKVHPRTRSFATYGLARIAQCNPEPAGKHRVWKTLHALLHDLRSPAPTEVTVAAILSLSALDLQGIADARARRALQDRTISSLDLFRQNHVVRRDGVIVGHIAPAIAKVLGRGATETHAQHKRRWVSQLNPDERPNLNCRRGAVIALGATAMSEEELAADRACSESLRKIFREGRDLQSRTLALVSLGQIGGAKNRTFLLDTLSKESKTLIRSWAALALGALERQRRADGGAVADPVIGKALLLQIKNMRNPHSRAAFAIALGLCRYEPATPALLDYLEKYRRMDEFSGYLTLSLALIGHRSAHAPVREVLRTAGRRTDVVREAAEALSLYDDREDSAVLMNRWGNGANFASSTAIATGLARIADVATVDQLIAMLEDSETELGIRSFLVATLGAIADPEFTSLSDRLAFGLNYRAVVRTLVYRGTGILELL